MLIFNEISPVMEPEIIRRITLPTTWSVRDGQLSAEVSDPMVNDDFIWLELWNNDMVTWKPVQIESKIDGQV